MVAQSTIAELEKRQQRLVSKLALVVRSLTRMKKVKLGQNPLETLLTCLLQLPHDFYQFFLNLFTIFPWKLIGIIMIVYGITEGFGEGWYYLFQRYYFKDILKLTPSQSQLMSAVARTPWNIKPIYGILADCFPIFGYHRTYYITFAGIVGTISWFSLSFHDLSLPFSVLAMLLGNHATASPDVIIDACVAEKSNEYPHMASDLQSLCSGSLAICGIIATVTSGFLIHSFGPADAFFFLSLTSAVLLFPSLLGWLGEEKVQFFYSPTSVSSSVFSSALPIETSHPSESISATEKLHILSHPPLLSCCSPPSPRSDLSSSSASTQPPLTPLSCFLTTELLSLHQNLFRMAFLITAIALALSLLTIFLHGHNHLILCIAILLSVLSISFIIISHLYQQHRTLSLVALFIFLRASLQIDTDQPFFYWYTEASDGPHFSVHFVGLISTIGFIAMFVAVAVYNRFLSNYSYQQIFLAAQFVTVLTPFLDLILIMRWNHFLFGGYLSLSDEMFILGDSAITPMIRRFIAIPTCILASKLCPAGGEATFFALLMALGNFGSDISCYVGGILAVTQLTSPWQLTSFPLFSSEPQGELKIGHPDYVYLPHLMVCKSLMRLVSIPLIFLLVPHGTPNDPPSAFLHTNDADTNTEKDRDRDVEMHSSTTGTGVASSDDFLDLSQRSSVSAVDLDTSSTPLTFRHRDHGSSDTCTSELQTPAPAALSPSLSGPPFPPICSHDLLLTVSSLLLISPRALME